MKNKGLKIAVILVSVILIAAILFASEYSASSEEVKVSSIMELRSALRNPKVSAITMDSETTVTVPKGATLTVPEGKTLVAAGQFSIKGTLVNHGTINNQSGIEVFGGTVKNDGVIQNGSGMDGEDTEYVSVISVANGGRIYNYIDGKEGVLNDYFEFGDYFKNGKAVTPCCGYGLGDVDLFPEMSDTFIRYAVAFGSEQIQPAIDAGYNFIIVCCKDKNGKTPTNLGGVTIPQGVILQVGGWNDASGLYRSDFVIEKGEAFTLSPNSAAFFLGTGLTLDVKGEIVKDGSSILQVYPGFNVIGNVPQ